ncbi:signal peptidase II [Herbiconiux sp.]|uniref:signal peptidase II n=1 Tax=Herbiconiux sp. TaxID=1871186 RepID=UPI0025C1A5D1|nr:signal peptidase II [Herbiconiux sp.]
MVAIDQASKWWAEANLSRTERIPLLGDLLGLQLAYNPGAAFSLGENATWIFTVLSVVAAVVALVFAFRIRRTSWAIVVGLLGGAATSHAIDRLFRAPSFGNGHVVDFLAYGNWFIGNIADIVIFSGAITAVLIGLRSPSAAPHSTTRK